MLIQLNEDLRVTAIPMNFVLEERKINKKTGVGYWSVAGYYANMEQVLNSLLNRRVQESECEGVRDIITEIRYNTSVILEQMKIRQEQGE
jgi:hypothetical protein